jgi:hypothetical protein
MKHLLYIFIIILCCNIATVTAQDDRISFDFIIFVDDHLWTTGTMALFVLRNETIGLVDTVKGSYHAGNLSMESSAYNRIMSDSVESIEMELEYKNINKLKEPSHIYSIIFNKKWFDCSYFVLKIYNLNFRKIRKYLPLIEGEDFTYIYDSSEGQMLREIKKN